jgi:hypothetical protein
MTYNMIIGNNQYLKKIQIKPHNFLKILIDISKFVSLSIKKKLSLNKLEKFEVEIKIRRPKIIIKPYFL